MNNEKLNEKNFIGKKLSELKTIISSDKIMITGIGDETFMCIANFDPTRLRVSLEPVKPQPGLVVEILVTEEDLKEIKNLSDEYEVIGEQLDESKKHFLSLRLKTDKPISFLRKTSKFFATDINRSNQSIINDLVITDIHRG